MPLHYDAWMQDLLRHTAVDTSVLILVAPDATQSAAKLFLDNSKVRLQAPVDDIVHCATLSVNVLFNRSEKYALLGISKNRKHATLVCFDTHLSNDSLKLLRNVFIN